MHKILLVEDNEVNRDMLSRRLARKGYEVAVASDGAEAVAKAQLERPDLVIMDLHMPVLDGWQATQQIKANPQTHQIPVIALTADAMAGEREKAIAVGCDDYDTKPVDLSQLVAKMTRLLTLTASPSAVPDSPKPSDTPFHLPLQRLLRTQLRHQDFDPPLYSIIGYCDLLLDSISRSQTLDAPESLRNDIQKILTSGEQLQKLIQAVLNPALVKVQQQEANLFAPILRREMLTPLSTIVGYCEILLEESPADFRPDLDRIYMSAQNLLSKVNSLDSLVERHIESMQASDTELRERQDAVRSSYPQQISSEDELFLMRDGQILVIDNDAYNCALLSRHLENQGFQVAFATTGKLAIEAIEQTSYDLILLEINLLDSSRLDILSQIKHHYNSQHTPILVMAAPDEWTAIVQSIAMGASDYLIRPYQSIMLKTKIAHHIERKQLKHQHKALTQEIAILQAELTNLDRSAVERFPAESFQSQEISGSSKKETNPPQADLPVTILLVEDNEMNADMLSRRLRRAGYEVTTASTGAQGVEKALLEQPQAILMDISLPVMDGCEATRRLKADAKTCQIPVIALTAHAMAGDRAKALDAGCDDYDTKPIDLPRLLGKLEDCLNATPPHLSAPTPGNLGKVEQQ